MRRCFFIFDYDQNLAEARRVIERGLVHATVPVPVEGSEAWSAAKAKGVDHVKAMIDQEMAGASVAVVLIGSRTASLGYVNYAIERAIRRHCGLLGIHVHLLRDPQAKPEERGAVPFEREAKRLLDGQHYAVHDWDPDQFTSWVREAATDWRNLVRPKPLDRVPPTLTF